MTSKLLIVLSVLTLVLSCKSKDDDSFNSENALLISADHYVNAADDAVQINSLKIEGDNLTINFGASGCDGDSWVINLIDSENILESDPPQRHLRLSLKNTEMCQAYITKELTFDIKALQTGGNKVVLHVTNQDNQQVLYTY